MHDLVLAIGGLRCKHVVYFAIQTKFTFVGKPWLWLTQLHNLIASKYGSVGGVLLINRTLVELEGKAKGAVVLHLTVGGLLISIKVGFHYPSSRPEFTGRVDGP